MFFKSKANESLEKAIMDLDLKQDENVATRTSSQDEFVLCEMSALELVTTAEEFEKMNNQTCSEISDGSIVNAQSISDVCDIVVKRHFRI